jgi:short-subunit dehydrogenase
MTAKGRALITGPTSGIGRALAEVFAREGHDLVLASRDQTRLEALALELEGRYGINALPLVADLAQPGAATALAERCPPIDYLVNNAGLGMRGPFLGGDPAREKAMLQANLLSVLDLIRALAPAMAARGRGGILNVASTAAFQAGPNMAVYSAGKTFRFGESLREELRNTGVTVTTLCPGPTATGFNASIGIRDTPMVRMSLMRPERVARSGYAGLLKGKATIIPGFWNRVGMWVGLLSPQGLTARVIAAVQRRI